MQIPLSINPPFELLIFQPFGIVLRIPVFANGAPPSRALTSMLLGGLCARRDGFPATDGRIDRISGAARLQETI
jgi:hypothetical protein